MARSKNKAIRRPDEVEVTSTRKTMKLRSPSVRRPANKFHSPSRKPTTGFISADTPPRRSPACSEPDFGSNVVHTERARAVLAGMKRSRRLKKLEAIRTPPPLPSIRHTPPRVVKKTALPPQPTINPPQAEKRKAKETTNPQPPEKRRAQQTTNPPPPEKRRAQQTTNPPPPEKSRAQPNLIDPTPNPPPLVVNEPDPVHPAPIILPPISNPTPPAPSTQPATPKSNPVAVYRRSPRCLSKYTGQANTEVRNRPPPMPNFSLQIEPQPSIAPIPSPAMSQHDEHTPPVAFFEPIAPDFQPSHASDADSASDGEAEESVDNVPSIRCKSKGFVLIGDVRGDKRKVRGVVNGTTVASYKHAFNKGLPIEVEFLSDGSGPANQTVNSLLVHEIGSAVRDKVPMLAPSFKKLEEKHRQVVYDHLNPNFVIDRKDDRLWNHIFNKACERYRDWKSDCKIFFLEYGTEVIPKEFLERRDQWAWLLIHFSVPKNQERGKTMSRVRNDSVRINHHSGNVPFYQRAAKLAAQGEKAHLIAAYDQVYSADPTGASLAAQMRDRVRQVMRDRYGDDTGDGIVLDDQEPLPVATQIDIITQVVGQKRGTYVSGVGKAFKRPPLPTGGARNAELKDKLQKQQDEIVEMKKEFQARIRVLEELVVRGGSANLANTNGSEGATSYGPHV